MSGETLPILNRSQCPPGSTWNPGINAVYPLAQRRADRALVEATIALLNSFSGRDAPNDATDHEIEAIAQALLSGRRAFRDLLDHEVLILPCDPYDDGMKAFLARNHALLNRWSSAEASVLRALQQINAARLEYLPAVRDIVAKPAAIQFSPATNRISNAVAAATVRKRWINEQTQQAVAGVPLSQQATATQQSRTASYGQSQTVFINALQETGAQQIALAQQQGLTVQQHSAKMAGVPETLFGRWCSVVRENLHIFQRFLAWNLKHFKCAEIPIWHLLQYPGSSGRHKPFERLFEHFINACSIFGDEYIRGIRSLRDRHRMDYCPNRGRHPGNRMSIFRGEPFVRFNYDGSYHDGRMVVHEISHALQTILAGRQDRPMIEEAQFAVETAAGVGECLHFSHLLNITPGGFDQDLLLANEVWHNMLDIFMNTLWAEFELSAHEYMESGGTSDSDWLCRQFIALLQKYCGQTPIANLAEIAILWADHHNFYLAPATQWMYPPSNAIAWTLNKNLIEGGAQGVKDYLAFLRLGNYVSSYEALLTIGIDLNADDCFAFAFKHFERLMNRLEATRLPAP